MNYRHGMSKTKIYGIWWAMITRCQNPKCKAFKNYGGRGITVCERWQKFENFYADMGDRPEGKTLERDDNSKGYSPNNCVWADRKTQGRNKRGIRMVTVNGVSKPMSEWADESGVAIGTIWQRLNKGWTAEEAVLTPIITKRKGIKRGEALRHHV